MPVLEEFISIKASSAEVKRFLTDPVLINQWLSPVMMIEPIEGELMTTGSSYLLRLKTLALVQATPYRVDKVEDGNIVQSFTGPWTGHNTWRWFPRDDVTIVLNRIDYEINNPAVRVFFNGLGIPFFALDMKVQLSQLRRLIENRPQSSPTPRAQIATES
ncbi:MAG: SRPBCC family protein [Chloroflexaceae bacterium]|nr:SRPBCC family protein [Chloroflexaceae bacterium]